MVFLDMESCGVHVEEKHAADAAECVSESSISSSSESAGVTKEGREGFLFLAEAQLIPHRSQQVFINWIFIIASAALLLDFLSLQSLLVDPSNPGYFAEMNNWFGVVSCVGWFLGFIVLAHWLHSVGATSMGLAGCYMKFLASIFFNLQPMTGMMNDPKLAGGFPRGGGGGLWWSNLVGILFFHSGNLVSCMDFYLHTPPGADKERGWLYHGNLPVTAMWVYQAATWILVAGNFLSCTFDGADWAPIVPTNHAPVYLCQCGGALGLLLGSVIYTVWCAGFHDWTNPPLGGAPQDSQAEAGGPQQARGAPSGGDDRLCSRFSFAAEAKHIPYRSQQMLINWVFILASTFLLLDFLALQTMLADPVHQGWFAELCDWFGTVSCLGWLLGFVLLAHWLDSVGATRMGQMGCILKLMAAVFFNLQPLTASMNDPAFAGGFARGGGVGLWWSNFLGILLFHAGNLVSCLDFYLNMPPGASKQEGWLFHGNLPVTAMWVYQAATWSLVAANFLSCTFAGASWAPLVPTHEAPVYVCQYVGALLLLLGSVIYSVWCAGFDDLWTRNPSPAP